MPNKEINMLFQILVSFIIARGKVTECGQGQKGEGKFI